MKNRFPDFLSSGSLSRLVFPHLQPYLPLQSKSNLCQARTPEILTKSNPIKNSLLEIKNKLENWVHSEKPREWSIVWNSRHQDSATAQPQLQNLNSIFTFSAIRPRNQKHKFIIHNFYFLFLDLIFIGFKVNFRIW